MAKGNERARFLQEWSAYLNGAAQQGQLTGKPLSLQIQGIAGPRAGALELYAGMQADKLLARLSRGNAATLRQFIPWDFTGEPMAYMAGRFVRVEAGWPIELAETMIPLQALNRRPELGGRWVAGKTESGATVVVGLNDKTAHFLISGQTGSGKSVALRSAVLQLAQDPENRIVLIDGKMGDGLGELARLPGVVGPVAIDGPEARQAMGWAAVEMRRRYESGDKSGRVVVVIDEFQEFIGDAVFVDLLRKLAGQGRGARVHLLAATQHPAIEAFGDPSTRRNLAGKLALRVGDPDASRVAVGGNLPRADYLLGAGDAYAVGPGTCHRLQMAYVDKRDVDQVSCSDGWDFESWPVLDGEAVGLALPETGAGWTYNGAELAHAVIAAVEEEGRPKLVRRLESAGLGKPGAERGIRLLNLGRECNTTLQEAGYHVQFGD